jgi:FkbM family methyltransferase
MNLMTVKRGVFRALDAPRRRWILELLGSVFVTVKRRQRCRVEYRDGVWLHHYRDVIIPGPRVGGSTPKEIFDDIDDRFRYDYDPAEGDVIVDIGAGFGDEALPLSRIVGPRGRILSFEAHPRAFAGLQLMCQMNDLRNVETFNVALVDREQTLRISDDDPIAKGNSVIGRQDGIDVRGDRFDRVVRDRGVDRIDFVKINVEGAELLVLEGMVESLPRARRVFVECHDFLADQGADPAMRTKAAVRAFLESHGFDVRTRADPRPWLNDSLYATNTRAHDTPAEVPPPASTADVPTGPRAS